MRGVSCRLGESQSETFKFEFYALEINDTKITLIYKALAHGHTDSEMLEALFYGDNKPLAFTPLNKFV